MATSSLCGTATPASMTKQDLQAPYPNSILPSSSVTRNQDGSISDVSLNSHVKSLSSAGLIPVRPDMDKLQGGDPVNDPSAPLAKYVQKENAFLNAVKAEYCFYESRYRYALNNLLDSVAQASLPASNNQPSQSQFEVYLPITKTLNQKLNDLTQVVNAVANLRYSLSRTDNKSINDINMTLSKRAADLKAQGAILESDGAAADLRKRMVEYTKEKNRATNNLLTLYAVLNIVAIGVLVTLSRT